MKRVMFAGGGTAGHINPAIAVADYIRAHEPECEIWFCGGKGNIEEKLVTRAGYQLFSFPMTGLARKLDKEGIRKNLRAIQNALAAVSGSKKILKKLEPNIVVGTGGYASFPMVYAAQQLGIKTVLMEANAIPGVTVKRLAGKADCVMTSFEETEKMLPNARRVICTGNPVREEIIGCRDRYFPPVFQNGLPMAACFWGSVGAYHMNKKMEDFICLAAKERAFNLVHAAGSNHFEWMESEIEEKGCSLKQADNIDLREYIYDMERVLGTADLVICRGGGSLSEVCAAGLPSIIVPSPFVAENHQEKNARVLEKAGAAVVITEQECTGELLYEAAKKLIRDRGRLKEMSKAALSLAKPQAVEDIYQTIKRIAEAGPDRMFP